MSINLRRRVPVSIRALAALPAGLSVNGAYVTAFDVSSFDRVRLRLTYDQDNAAGTSYARLAMREGPTAADLADVTIANGGAIATIATAGSEGLETPADRWLLAFPARDGTFSFVIDTSEYRFLSIGFAEVNQGVTPGNASATIEALVSSGT